MSPTRLILREDVARLGHAGDLVSVKPGYARNYLIPQGKAIVATESRIKEIDHHKRIIADKQTNIVPIQGQLRRCDFLDLNCNLFYLHPTAPVIDKLSNNPLISSLWARAFHRLRRGPRPL